MEKISVMKKTRVSPGTNTDWRRAGYGGPVEGGGADRRWHLSLDLSDKEKQQDRNDPGVESPSERRASAKVLRSEVF